MNPAFTILFVSEKNRQRSLEKMMQPLTLPDLKLAARDFVRELSLTPIADLYGATDGKAIGTYVEQKFHRFLQEHFSHSPGDRKSTRLNSSHQLISYAVF